MKVGRILLMSALVTSCRGQWDENRSLLRRHRGSSFEKNDYLKDFRDADGGGSRSPTLSPTPNPSTQSPVATNSPTSPPSPTLSPATANPSLSPVTANPTLSPSTDQPSVSPSTLQPTSAPSTAQPSSSPSLSPSSSIEPSFSPSEAPSPRPEVWQQLGQNIYGAAPNDWFGSSVDLSSNGRTLACGAIFNDGNGNDAGHVRAYTYDDSSQTWVQRGQDLEGETAVDYFGVALSMSADGNTLAIGAPNNDGFGGALNSAGHVRVFQFIDNLSQWIQIGSDINGENAFDFSGDSVSLSDDGTLVAVGAPALNQVPGYVKVYQLTAIGRGQNQWVQLGQTLLGNELRFGRAVSLSGDGTTVAIGSGDTNSVGQVLAFEFDTASSLWVQKGQDLDGEVNGDLFGRSVALSADGNILVIGSRFTIDDDTGTGVVKTFQYDVLGDIWVQIGQDVDGEASGDNFGGSVAVTPAGTTFAAGARRNDANGEASGHARVFDFDSTGEEWFQVGMDLDGTGEGDLFGHDVALSDDGKTIAIGAINNDDEGNNIGLVQVYILQ